MNSPQRIRVRQLIEHEMAKFQAARSARNFAVAWAALERAHIVSQPFLGPHLASHWAMLVFAVQQRDWRETTGQIVRLVLVPLGSLTGRIPAGNTGRSNVSAFESMPIPADLRAKITEASK